MLKNDIKLIDECVDFGDAIYERPWERIKKVLEELAQQSHNNQSKYAEQICSQCVVVASCSIRKNNPKIIGCAYIYE